jgi:hypothetical protein
MSSNDEIFRVLGQLQSSVSNIEKNTSTIPKLTSDLAVAQAAIKEIKPKVERHQKIMWIGTGVMGVFSTAWTLVLAWLEGGHR